MCFFMYMLRTSFRIGKMAAGCAFLFITLSLCAIDFAPAGVCVLFKC